MLFDMSMFRRAAVRASHFDEPSDAWKLLGSGHFSSVFKHERYTDIVLKVSGPAGFGDGEFDTEEDEDGNDDGYKVDGWQWFAQYAMANPHKHLPVILHYEQIREGFAWAVLPLYKRATHGNKTRYRWDSALYGNENDGGDTYKKVPKWLRNLRREMLAFDPHMGVDLHSGNVMEDSCGRLIMTDPLGFSSHRVTV